MPRKKRILSGRLGTHEKSSYESAFAVVSWITRRFREWKSTGKPLKLKHMDESISYGVIDYQEHVWEDVVEEWNACCDEKDVDEFKNAFQCVIKRINSWVDDQLCEDERYRLLNAVRQRRHHAKKTSKERTQLVTVRIDRRIYMAATQAIPQGEKSKIINRLLQRFAEDNTLRESIIAESGQAVK